MGDSIDLTPLVRAGFEYKALKTWEGREGPAFQANLYYGGKKVAMVTEDGYGGEIRIDWAGLRWDGSTYTPSKAATSATEAKVALDAIVAATPKVTAYETPLAVDAGWLLDELCSFTLLARDCKRKTCFRRPTDDGGTYATINRPYDASMKAYIEKKYPGATIINEEVNAILGVAA